MQAEIAYPRDRGERFPTKTHGLNAEEIVRGADLAGGVAGDRQWEIFERDPRTIVDDPNQIPATLGHGDIHRASPSVEGVLDQFLNDAGGAFDHFRRRRSGQRRGKEEAKYGPASRRAPSLATIC